MYTFESRIRYSEIDRSGELTLESLIDYFQDCSTFQTQDGPASMEYLRDKGIVWVLSSWQIVVNRYPKLCEDVVIGTVPYDMRGAIGYRNFFMDTRDGERLAVANSIWTLVDIEKGFPSRITDEILKAYPLEPKLDMKYEGRKIEISEEDERFWGEEIQVRQHNLDTNNHVNNGQYVRIAMDCLPKRDLKVVAMRAEYKKQSRLGDVLCPVVIMSKKDDNDKYTVSLNGEDGKPVCIVELITQA